MRPVIKINDSRKDAIVAVASGEVVADTHHAVAGAADDDRTSAVDCGRMNQIRWQRPRRRG
jgi:hypothetical protein